jgi:fluoride exporter
MQPYLAIAVGGTLGCWARYAMTNLVQAIYGRDFPYATLSINVLGSFLMGFLFGVVTRTSFWQCESRRIELVLGCRSGSPRLERFASEDAERVAGREVALNVEVVVDGGVNGQKALG